MHRLSPKERAFAIKFMQADLQTVDWRLYDGAKTSWYCMMTRCKNPNHRSYETYSEVGVCDRWHEFPLFLMDMGPRPLGMSLDRVNPHWSYEPLNCRWADKKTQTRNRRCKREVIWEGRPMMQVDVARLSGMSEATVSRRVKAGQIEIVR